MKDKSWQTLQWRDLHIKIYKLQKQIYYSSLDKESFLLRKLQQIALNHTAFKKMAVRYVTQDNREKNKNPLPPLLGIRFAEKRLLLARNLKLSGKDLKINSQFLLDPQLGGKLSLAKEQIALMVLQPEWEAQFEKNNYAFRPGRSCHDALEAIFKSIVRKSKYVLHGQISVKKMPLVKKSLLRKIDTFPLMRSQIKRWLDSFSGKLLFSHNGSIYPLLSNIALHGLEINLKDAIRQCTICDDTGRLVSPSSKEKMLSVIRCQDRLLLSFSKVEQLLEMKKICEDWLEERGFSWNSTLGHTLLSREGAVAGFSFLGFSIRQYPLGKYASELPFKTIIKPDGDSIKNHLLHIKKLLEGAQKCETVVAQLNPLIKKWSLYYRTIVSSEIFSYVDKQLHRLLFAWCKKKHPTRGGKWIYKKYLKRIDGRLHFGYESAAREWRSVHMHSEINIVRFVKVIGEKSPYDGDWEYWSNRVLKMWKHTPRWKALFKIQLGRCALCHLHFTSQDVIEMDHILSKKNGGESVFANLQLLHGHCQDKKTSQDLYSYKFTAKETLEAG